MNPDGTGVRRLYESGGAFGPVWAPGGAKIAYTDWRRAGNRDIFVMNADGTGVTRLTREPADDWQPTWSPDGRRIAFTRQLGALIEIYVMNADGTHRTRLPTSLGGWTPAWSPDGTKIAFASIGYSTRDTPMSGIYVTDLDGAGTTTLIEGTAGAIGPVWSPHGTRIAYESGGNIWVTRADGSQRTKLTHHPASRQASPSAPAWSPDGTRIAFTSDVDGDPEIYVMNAEGTDVTQLTHATGEDFGPAWRVVPASVVKSLPAPAPDTPIPPEELVGSTCYLSSTAGDFDGDGRVDTAVAYTPGSAGENCSPHAKPHLSVFLATGERMDEVFRDCENDPICPTFGAPDLDGDGRSELAVDVSWGATFNEFGVYRVARHGLVALHMAPPGDPAGNLPPGPVRFETASSLSYWGTLTCRTGPGGTQLVVQRFGEAHGSGVNQAWRVHETVMTAVGNKFSVRSARDLTLDPAGAEALRSAGSGCSF